jgi:hypothetical protein
MPDETKSNRIIAHNLTAQAAFNVAGNPPSTRLESGVANCYPGLEYDHRNLDRRFFPGLVVEYVSQSGAAAPDSARQGVRVVSTDSGESDLSAPDPAYAAIVDALITQLDLLQSKLSPTAPWFITAIEQEGTRLSFADKNGVPFDGIMAWRLVRNLRPGPVTVEVAARVDGAPAPITLVGWRRLYTSPDTGVIDLTYQPGELTQSLCSPWTHDFRDCSCTYWASNHPDIVFPAISEADKLQPSGLPSEPQDEQRIIWLRDPEAAGLHAEPLPSPPQNRPYEISHFQINEQWQDLAVVLEGHEHKGIYISRSSRYDWAVPFATDDQLWNQLNRLAGLEHAVTLLYLYAIFSVRDRTDAQSDPTSWPTLIDDALFTRSVLLDVAIGEMQHLRWVNHILAGVAEALHRTYTPAVVPPASVIPDAHGDWNRHIDVAPLTLKTLDLFVDIERASAFIDGQYARVTATLRQKRFPPNLHQLSSNIAEEGEEHFLRFRDLQRVLHPYAGHEDVYLRPIKPGNPREADVQQALDLYRKITDLLITGYQFGDRQNQRALGEARTLMFDLQSQAEDLARKGIGVPFFAIWR